MVNSQLSRKLLYLLGAAVVCLVLYLLVLTFSRSGETKVEINVIPEDSLIYINGKQITETVTYLKPGEYEFSAKKDGFKEDKQKITIEDEDTVVELIPAPDSQEAFDFLENNPELQRQREVIGGKRANLAGSELEEETPLIALLPTDQLDRINGLFSLDYGPSPVRENGVFIEVSSLSPKGRANAAKWIRERGTDPTDLEIRYVDFENPLAEREEH